MGFDLSGIKPENKKGEYFRNNVWWWRPLWGYIAKNCDKILTSDEIQAGGFNDGKAISQAKTNKIVKKLKKLLKKGEVKKFEKEYILKLNKMPDEKCDLCKGTGTRKDKYTKFKSTKCNKCDGKGKVRPSDTWYPFAEENVKEFVKFAENSGGFSIY